MIVVIQNHLIQPELSVIRSHSKEHLKQQIEDIRSMLESSRDAFADGAKVTQINLNLDQYVMLLLVSNLGSFVTDSLIEEIKNG